MTVYNFTGANGDPLPSGITSIDGTFEIQSNSLAATGAVPTSGAWIATNDAAGTADGVGSIIVNANSSVASGGTGLLFRYVDINNYWFANIQPSTGKLRLFRRVAGVNTVPGEYVIPSYSNSTSYTISTNNSGTSIDIELNAVSRVTTTDSAHQTATIYGIRMGDTTQRVDEFTVPTVASDSVTADAIRAYIQRVSGFITLAVSGSYTGTPTNIERKVIYTDDLTTVSGFDWATYITSPAGGTFSGTDIVLPESTRQYRVELRFSNDIGVTGSSNGFNTCDYWITYGQSLAEKLSSDGTSVTPDAIAKYANSTTGVITTPTAGNGATTFLNSLVTETGIPQIMVNTGVGSMALLEVNESTAGNFLWDPLDPNTTRYLEVTAAITAIGGLLAGAIYIQGERDARGGFDLGTWGSSLADHFAQLRTDTRADLPIIIGVLGRDLAGTSPADWDTVQQAQITLADSDPDIYYVVKYDLPLADNVHLTAAANIPFGERLANTAITNILGGSANWQAPVVSSIQVVSTTQTRINITHGQGTDFTPLTGITGIELTEAGDGYAVTGISADQETATSILVTHDAAVVTAGRVYYGTIPVITGVVLDNSTLNLPLVPSTNNSITGPDSTLTLTMPEPVFSFNVVANPSLVSVSFNFEVTKPKFSLNRYSNSFNGIINTPAAFVGVKK